MHHLVPALLALLIALAGCTAPEHPAPPEGEALQSQSGEATDPPFVPPKDARASGVLVVEELASAVVQELGISAGQGEGAIRAAYRYLIERVYFADPVGLDAWRYLADDDMTPIPYLENRALSPLLFGIGSCEDFAAALVMLLRCAGFEAEYVAGYTLSVEQVYIDHAWAVVQWQGDWYHLDPQLEQNVMKSGVLTYRYYMKGDDDLLVDHRWGENLIAHWPDMPAAEKQAIRERHCPPPCPASWPTPNPEPIPAPPRANRTDVETTIRRLQQESGKGELPPIALNVEPPVLVAEHHITPPLLAEAAQGYGRSLLADEEAALYDRLAATIPHLSGEVVLSLPELDSGAVKRAVDAFTGDFAALYWVRFDQPQTQGTRRLTAAPLLEQAEVLRRQAEIDAAAREILQPIQHAAPFETALFIHDYLAQSIRYRDGTAGDGGNLYGALVERSAYCDGYARAFHYLAVQAGLQCAYLTGKSERGVDHAWNAVLLDGVWHYLDVTWDRPIFSADRVYHDYFLIDEEELLRERQQDGQGLVAISGEPTGYYRRTGYALEGEPDAERLADVFFRQLCAEWPPVGAAAEFAPFFLEAKVLGDSDDYVRWKEFYIKQAFRVLRSMEARAREEDLPFAVSFDTSVRCNFNDKVQVLTFYPLVKAYMPDEDPVHTEQNGIRGLGIWRSRL